MKNGEVVRIILKGVNERGGHQDAEDGGCSKGILPRLPVEGEQAVEFRVEITPDFARTPGRGVFPWFIGIRLGWRGKVKKVVMVRDAGRVLPGGAVGEGGTMADWMRRIYY